MSDKYNSADMASAKSYLEDMELKMQEAAKALSSVNTSTIGVMAVNELQKILDDSIADANLAKNSAKSASGTIAKKIKSLG